MRSASPAGRTLTFLSSRLVSAPLANTGGVVHDLFSRDLGGYAVAIYGLSSTDGKPLVPPTLRDPAHATREQALLSETSLEVTSAKSLAGGICTGSNWPYSEQYGSFSTSACPKLATLF